MNVIEHAKVLIGRDIRKTFRRDTGEIVQALDAVSLEVKHGALTALVGPDGAGKTTLIRLAAGLMTADSGELTILGVDVAAHPQLIQDRIGYMPQKFGLYEDLSVQENLDLYADLHGVTVRRAAPTLPSTDGDDRPGSVHATFGRKVVGRDEAETRARLHLGPRA